METRDDSEDFGSVAIIGMAGRFPGAENIDEFWQNIRDGVETITFFSDEELLAAGVEKTVLERANYVKAAGMLKNIEQFDASFFAISAREAEIIDPQHRIFLECAWEALENAGYDSQRYKGRIGVFGGVNMSAYLLNIYSQRELLSLVDGMTIKHGNDKDYVATRTSYKLDLKGPSFSVQTGCSTSLVATHLACQSLLNGECDIALAGAVNLNIPQKEGYFYHEGGVTSLDGHCRTFDAQASGTLFTSGAGLTVLKRLQDARRDGDSIYAVIKGSAINNDGAAKVGYMAPSVEGQSSVIAEALSIADVAPESISYVEAHGTGTVLGDPIEIAALTRAFRAKTQATGFCAIGSLKTNLGHLNVASGVAGLLKTALALKYGQIPPSLHFTKPNPAIDFEHSPFYVNTKLVSWERGLEPRRAGVSSFGMGGTNVHTILEEAPPDHEGSSSRSWQLLLLSARTTPALEVMSESLRDHFVAHPHLHLANVAYTLQLGRHEFAQRRMLLVRNAEEAVTALQSNHSEKIFTRQNVLDAPSVAFLFPGQGAQDVNIGLELYLHEPFFRAQIEHCSRLLQPLLGEDIRELLYPEPDLQAEAATRLSQTALTQPAMFVVEYAFARLWMEWGIRPRAMLGHSLGEYVAACLAGVFSLETALKLVVERGRLIAQYAAPGKMLSIQLPEEQVRSLLSDRLSIAAINGPNATVISGGSADIEEMHMRLSREGHVSRLLRTSHAFHSWMMKPVQKMFRDILAEVAFEVPGIPYVSNVTGTWITPAQAIDPDYWMTHLLAPVRFSAGLQTLLGEEKPLLLEVGPGNALSSLARQISEGQETAGILTSTRHRRQYSEDLFHVLQTLGNLWLAGVSINWERFYAFEQRRRVPLPTYPFERQRYWVEFCGLPTRSQIATVMKETVEESKPSFPQSIQAEREQETLSLYPRPNVPGQFVAAETALQKRMAQIWQKLFRIEPVGISDDFFDLGGDSMLVAQLAREVQAGFEVSVPLHVFFEATTIATICQMIEQRMESPGIEISREIDFVQESLLDAAIQPQEAAAIARGTFTAPKKIFLTGATGFFGAFLLQELLLHTNAEIYTLVRAPDVKEAEDRLRETLTSSRMPDLLSMLGKRIHPVPGNLAAPRLGFSQERFMFLAQQIDTIYHCGAIVNFVYPYHSLRATNVQGTQEVLRLASEIQRKIVHYISSTAVFDAPGYYTGETIGEATPLAHVEHLATGYAQSKWVAEHLIEQAGKRGLPVSIYRIGNIGADSTSGVWNTNEMLSRAIKACIQLGYAPDIDLRVTLLPVNYVSRALVSFSLHKEAWGQKFHIVDQQGVSWHQIVAWLRSAGYPLQMLPYPEWYTLLREQMTPENALYPLIAALPSGINPAEVTIGEEGERHFGTQNSAEILLQSHLSCPPCDEQYFQTMLTFFQHIGFLPPVPQGRLMQ